MALAAIVLLIISDPNAAGWVTLLVAMVVVGVMAHRTPAIRGALHLGFVVRVILMIVGVYWLVLPESTSDAVTFEAYGWHIAQTGIDNALFYLTSGARTYEFFIGMLYSLFGRCLMVPLAINVFLGTLCILETYRAVILIRPEKTAARRAAWTVALFPTFVLYSAVMLREAIVVYLAILGTRYLIQHFSTQHTTVLLKSLVAFALGGLLHAGLTAMLPVVLFVALTNGVTLREMSLRRVVRTVPVVVFGIAVLGALYQQGWGIDKFRGALMGTSNRGGLIRDLGHLRTTTESHYIATAAKTPGDVIKQTPLRLILFLFAPFPWMLRQPRHLIGFLDASIYIYIAYRTIRDLQAIRSSPARRSVLLLAVVLIWIYAMGSFNFGQAIRHRLKTLPLLIVLVLTSPCFSDQSE